MGKRGTRNTGQRSTLVDHLPTAVCSGALPLPLTLVISLTPGPELGCASSFCLPPTPPSPTSFSLCWDSFYRVRPTLPRKAFLSQGRHQSLTQHLRHPPCSDNLLTDLCLASSVVPGACYYAWPIIGTSSVAKLMHQLPDSTLSCLPRAV